MMTDDSIERFARPSTALAMAVVIVSVFGWSVIVDTPTRLAMSVLGIVFLGLGTLGWLWAERRGATAIALWLGVLLALAAAALWLTHLGAFLIAMPLIGFAVVYGGLRWGILVTAFFLAFAVACKVSWGASPIDVYAGSTGFLPGAVFVVVLALVIVRERDAQQQLRRYATQVEELATTRERNRIARDIHDSVGHYLTVVHVQIEAARATVTSDPTASSACLGRAQDFAREGLAELRRSVSMLRSGDLEQRPFGLALAALVDDCRGRGLEIELVVEGPPQPLTPAVEFTLYRAAQEALTNVARHANATQVRCTLRHAAGEVTLTIADDGIGAIATDGGFGLVGLRERAHLVGGSVQITTAPGRGFTVEVRIST
ncbi:MAG: sensor histidine kinase [Kofleriaceae bacterium]